MHLCAAQVPSYAVAQVLGSTLASLTLRVVFGGATAREHFFGTAPSGSDAQAVALEFVISFYLMFVVSGVATDNRAVSTKPPTVRIHYFFFFSPPQLL